MSCRMYWRRKIVHHSKLENKKSGFCVNVPLSETVSCVAICDPDSKINKTCIQISCQTEVVSSYESEQTASKNETEIVL